MTLWNDENKPDPSWESNPLLHALKDRIITTFYLIKVIFIFVEAKFNLYLV